MRQLITLGGKIDRIVMPGGLPIRLRESARAVSLIGSVLALVVLDGQFGGANLLVLDAAGEELARLGTTCGTGVVDQVLEIEGEIRVIEVTPRGDFQARFDVDQLSLTRVAEWR